MKRNEVFGIPQKSVEYVVENPIIFVSLQLKYLIFDNMESLIYSELLDWKGRENRRLLLLLRPRRVGKAYNLKEFGACEFDSLVYINCYKDSHGAFLETRRGALFQ